MRTEKRKLVRGSKKNIVVLYHGDCTDGFGGAWAAWKKLGSTAEYIGLFRGNPLPAGLKGKKLYFIDFVYAPEITKKLIRDNKKVIGLDHHVTVKDSVKLMAEGSVYSENHSGAVVAWEYFHPGKPTPRLLRYIEDRDLWRWKLPHAKEIFAGANFSEGANYNFKLFGAMAKKFESDKFLKKCIKDGKIVSSVWDNIIAELGGLAEWVTLEGKRGLAVNAPHIFSSKLGNYLMENKKAEFGLIWHVQGGEIRVSLRSGKRGADVAKICEKYGGGGHRGAAGFLIKGLKNIPWRKIKN